MLARILVVEDDPFIREVIATALGEEGFPVDVVEDGARAWRYLASHRPSMAIVDIALPGMDGLTLCRELRARETDDHLPVIMVSAMTSPSVVKAARDAGADLFLDKPFDLGDLLSYVHELLTPEGLSMPMAEVGVDAGVSGGD